MALSRSGIAFETFGSPEAPALVFSAGLGGGGNYWRAHAEALSDAYHAVIYDQAGTAESKGVPLPEPYSVEAMAEDVVDVLDTIGVERAHFVGHAAGGCVGLDLALHHPGRVASVTVVNGWARVDRHFARCMEIRRGILEAQGVEAYLRAQPLFLFPADWLDAHLDELDAGLAHHIADFQGRDTLFARMAALERFDATALVADIVAPVLLVSARDDLLVNAQASERLAGLLGNVKCVSFERGGHAINVTEFAKFNAELRQFLASASQ
ncbi:pyrimidine utilization protein D [Novosphingobium panipatense]|uniref:Putative carbamate hydrolase RutD n=1 Tax=Novosphingobium panipatense TaxID=428991 RepID=A0ABY1QWJ8_9SPHN|nr:pyrimidine utilization protein D [Novosphingobium panipatense]SMP82487.1 aminoacrylate hydrolase [Novosphingobium panipatense]